MSEKRPKTVLVTGVTGQDGSYMVDYLLATTDHLVYGMVRRTSRPDYGNLEGALSNPRFTLVTGDLSDTTSIDTLVREIHPDYLINLGCQSFVGASWATPESTLDVAAVGVLRCLEAIRKHVPHCRFYSAGSSEELGDVAYTPQDEKHPMRPRSVYGAGKAAARMITKVYRESYHLYAIHGTLFNHESPRRGVEFVTRKVAIGVARIAKALKEGQAFKPIELGNLDAMRDWSHARDFVRGIWMMLNQEEPKELLLASGETHSIREFVEMAFRDAGIRGEWYKGNTPEDEAYATNTVWEMTRFAGSGVYKTLVRVNPAFYRPNEVALLHGDSTRARRELGWTPEVTFPQLVSEMVQTELRRAGL